MTRRCSALTAATRCGSSSSALTRRAAAARQNATAAVFRTSTSTINRLFFGQMVERRMSRACRPLPCRRRFRATELADSLDQLIRIANDGIGELRQYLKALKKTRPGKHDTSLLNAVRAQAQKFAAFYGIDTQVIAQADIQVNIPLQTDVLHIVREGLSNILRHTSAKRATIKVRKARGRLMLELINDKADEAARKNFYPRSIGERATQLGGRVSVRHGTGRRTVVAVELPLGVVRDDDRARSRLLAPSSA